MDPIWRPLESTDFLGVLLEDRYDLLGAEVHCLYCIVSGACRDDMRTHPRHAGHSVRVALDRPKTDGFGCVYHLQHAHIRSGPDDGANWIPFYATVKGVVHELRNFRYVVVFVLV